MEWRPIETAPRDGTPILVWHPPDVMWEEGVTYVVRWETGVWPQLKKDGAWIEAWGEQYAMFEPTHWMPLPAPPQS